jgi:hypothetical protein
MQAFQDGLRLVSGAYHFAVTAYTRRKLKRGFVEGLDRKSGGVPLLSPPVASFIASNIDAQYDDAGMSQMASKNPVGRIGCCGRFGKVKSEKSGTFWDILRHLGHDAGDGKRGSTPTPGHSGADGCRLRVMRDRRAAPDLVARFRVRLYQNMIRGGAAGSIRDQETRPAPLCPGVGACFTRDDALGAGIVRHHLARIARGYTNLYSLGTATGCTGSLSHLKPVAGERSCVELRISSQVMVLPE